MASAAKYVSPPLYLPRGTGDDKRMMVGSTGTTTIQLVEETDLRDDRGDVVFEPREIVTLPLGTKEIYTQNRMCGDFYCFIEGNRQVAATGDTLNAAFLAAIALAERKQSA